MAFVRTESMLDIQGSRSRLREVIAKYPQLTNLPVGDFYKARCTALLSVVWSLLADSRSFHCLSLSLRWTLIYEVAA